MFGEGALVKGALRTSTALALDDTVALAFDQATFDQVLATSPEVAARVLSQLIRRLREAEDQIEILMLRDAQSKVVVALIKLGQQQLAQDGRPSGQVALMLSPLELSAHAGLDVDTVKRIVTQLRIEVMCGSKRNASSCRTWITCASYTACSAVKDQLRGPNRERGQG